MQLGTVTALMPRVYTAFTNPHLQLKRPSIHTGRFCASNINVVPGENGRSKKGMTYFPHLAPKERSLEKHERGMFSQQGCSLKPQMNTVFNRTLVLLVSYSRPRNPHEVSVGVKMESQRK